MGEKTKSVKSISTHKSRRDFLKTAAIAGGAAAGVIGFPGVMRLSAAESINIKMQTAWDAGTLGGLYADDLNILVLLL